MIEPGADAGRDGDAASQYEEVTLNWALHALLHDLMHGRLQTRPDRRWPVVP
jgi:hypothetical protein